MRGSNETTRTTTTTTPLAERAAAASTAVGPGATRSPLAGTPALLRLMLRRDRMRLSLWVLGIGLMGFYFAGAIQVVAEDRAQLAQMTTMFADPVGRLMTGPAYGMDAPTFERFYATGYILFLFILAALMSIFTVVRHTRAEEQTGRAELIRANVVGRHATLTAALLLVLLADVLVGLLVSAGALAAGYATAGSLLVGAAAVAVGMFFAGAAAVTAQLSESSRGASAMAGALLGLAYLIRMGGDMAEQGGGTLSWFSPLGWSQQTAPYVHDHWWPLLPLVGCAVGFVWLGYWLSTRRDVEASLMPSRLGRARARPSLGTPMGMAYRILRGGLRGWTIALVLTALLFGSYAESMIDAADALPEEFAAIFSGDSMMLGYLAYIALFLAIFVAAAGVSGLTQLHGEEARGRAELSLSTPMSRTRWLAAHLAVLLLGLGLMLLLTGLGTALGALAVLGEDGVQHADDLVLASLHQAAPVLAVLGIVVALFGWLPRLAGVVGWLLLGYAAVMTNFGSLLELPAVMEDLNVFGHLAQVPVEGVDWAPFLVLSGIGVVGILLGMIGWNRREVAAG
ncbi:ABC transporter permease [Nesterenkonia sp. F]|uniref:ABC transporter permease n=1 Tax=Nesterenkonia sp. F TaxID=795955 RepID=UPI000255D2B2|nr:hypothetical protein [Nesterenkonia sp. F]